MEKYGFSDYVAVLKYGFSDYVAVLKYGFSDHSFLKITLWCLLYCISARSANGKSSISVLFKTPDVSIFSQLQYLKRHNGVVSHDIHHFKIR